MAIYTAADYNAPIYQSPAAGAVVCRPFTALVNSTAGGSLNGVPNVTTLAINDVIALCTLPGQGYGIVLLDYFIDFAKLDTNGSPLLVMSLGTQLTSTTVGASTSSLDTGSVSSAAAGQFATLITPNTTTDTRLTPSIYASNAAAPASLPVTYPVGALPYSISNQPGGPAQVPNSGLYDLILTVTAAAATVSAVNAFIKGWVMYQTIGSILQS